MAAADPIPGLTLYPIHHEFSSNTWKVSASQIKKWMECPRKWGYSYINGYPDPPKSSAQLGTDTHEELRIFYLTGEPPEDSRAGKLAQRLLEYLPSREKASVIEDRVRFSFQDGDGPPVVYNAILDLAAVDENGVTVYDYKTSSNPTKYGLVPNTMVQDAQVLMYSIWSLAAYSISVVHPQWTYTSTRKKLTYPVRRPIQREEALRHFRSRVHPVGLQIVHARKTVPDGELLPAREEACGLYGGCPYADFCPHDPWAAIVAKHDKGKTPMGLKNLLAQSEGETMQPGRAVNAPEGPKNADVAEVISKEVGVTAGNKSEKKDEVARVAEAAAGAETPEEAVGKMHASHNPSVDPTLEVFLRLCYLGGHQAFAPTKAKGTTTNPYVSSKLLKSTAKAGLIEYKKREDKMNFVTLTDLGRAKAEELWQPRKTTKSSATPSPKAEVADAAPAISNASLDKLAEVIASVKGLPDHQYKGLVYAILLAGTQDEDEAQTLYDGWEDWDGGAS